MRPLPCRRGSWRLIPAWPRPSLQAVGKRLEPVGRPEEGAGAVLVGLEVGGFRNLAVGEEPVAACVHRGREGGAAASAAHQVAEMTRACPRLGSRRRTNILQIAFAGAALKNVISEGKLRRTAASLGGIWEKG